jgi:RNA polymerase sigma-70 factor (ECF subfamily)
VDDSSLHTRASLLLRLRRGAGDQTAWAEFVERYGRPIHAWCRRWGLQEADAQDVTQTVLLKLAGALRTFEYDPQRRFRAWLKTVTYRAWSDFLSARRREVAGSGDSEVHGLLDTVEARDDLAARLDAAFDQELLDRAVAQVRQRLEPNTWEAYRLTAVEGLSGAEAAARLGMQVAAVFKAKSRAHKMLQEAVRALEDEADA